MKILIDECLPRKLKSALPEHDVMTVPEVGWSGKKNGELLRLMAGIYDLFITIDSNLKHQHQLENLSLCFIVLSAKNNKLETLLPLIPAVRRLWKRYDPVRSWSLKETRSHRQNISITNEVRTCPIPYEIRLTPG